MRVDTFDYELPPELIAQEPAPDRSSSRLLVLEAKTGRTEHTHFAQIENYLRPGDTLVLNDTKVVRARLHGIRHRTGGKWEGLFIHAADEHWELMLKTRGKPRPGEVLLAQPEGAAEGAALELEVIERRAEGTWLVRPLVTAASADPVFVESILARIGHVPIPPYIRAGRESVADRERYQTVYAARPGAVAAPTAGLHFTEALLTRLAERGVLFERLTLHVGPGTFQPVKVADTADHVMHAEWCELTAQVAQRLAARRAEGSRIIAVGTTAARVLESACRPTGRIEPYRGWTDLFIVPGYPFRAIDGLITNFHLPKSTLLMLVSALAGTEKILAAYRQAIAQRYRFYSYGDAMLISPLGQEGIKGGY